MSHLYLHVPFCARRCSYCDFAIAVRRVIPSERFVDVALAEYRMRRAAEGWSDAPFETVYLGGGTPSRLVPEAIATLLAAFPRRAGAEVTLEANPDDVTPAAAAAWRAAGVNRVSLGIQSFDDRVLGWMHRTHDAAAARRAFAVLREAGMPSLSVDLIFALPEHVGQDLQADLAAVATLQPDHVSAYGLTLERRTPYARWVERGTAMPPTDDRYSAEFLLVHDALTGAGFEHYEISNFGRPGARSRHNSAYWSGAEYVGLGPSAHGLHGVERRWNLREWVAYARAVAAARDPVAEREVLTAAQQALERVYLGLRTSEGLSRAEAARLAPGPLLAAASAGWLTTSDRVRPTVEGWLVLDALVPALTTFSEGG
jgi:oxygen-independent coproporphyrinogen-3 oxidase